MKKIPYFWKEIWDEKTFEKEFSLFLLAKPTRSTIFQIIRKFKNKTKIKKPKIVEIGCGSGLFTLFISKKLNLNPFLFDISPFSLKLVKMNSIRLGVNAHIRYGNILNIPLPSDFAEIVWSGGVNEHFIGKNRIKTFDEMIRVAKRGGLVIIIVPSAHSVFYRFGKGFRELIGKFKILEVPYSENEVKSILNTLSNKYKFRFNITKEGILSSLIWLLPGRFLIIKKFITRISNKKIRVLDNLGYSLIVTIEKL